MVDHRTSRLRVPQAGRHAAMDVALLGYDLRLVDGQPTVNPITKRCEDHGCVVGKPFRAVAVLPTPTVLQILREIPVVESRNRRDATGEQAVNQPVIKAETRLLMLPVPFGSTRGQAIENR